MDRKQFRKALLESLNCQRKKKLNEEMDLDAIREKIEEMDDSDFISLLNETRLHEPIYANDASFFSMFDDSYDVAEMVYYGVKYADYDYDSDYVTYDAYGRLTTAYIDDIKEEVIDDLVKEVAESEKLQKLL